MYEVIYASTIERLLEKVRLLDDYIPTGGIVPVYHKGESFSTTSYVEIDFNSKTYYQNVTFMQTLYKPQTKELL